MKQFLNAFSYLLIAAILLFFISFIADFLSGTGAWPDQLCEFKGKWNYVRQGYIAGCEFSHWMNK